MLRDKPGLYAAYPFRYSRSPVPVRHIQPGSMEPSFEYVWKFGTTYNVCQSQHRQNSQLVPVPTIAVKPQVTARQSKAASQVFGKCLLLN
jgi:hypothetical protein